MPYSSKLTLSERILIYYAKGGVPLTIPQMTRFFDCAYKHANEKVTHLCALGYLQIVGRDGRSRLIGQGERLK